MTAETGFMELVQLHERTWGMEAYPERPTLAELLNSPVVVLWTNEPPAANRPSQRMSATQSINARFTFSVHPNVDSLDQVLFSLVIQTRPSPYERRKIARIFINKKPARIAGVHLILDKI